MTHPVFANDGRHLPSRLTTGHADRSRADSRWIVEVDVDAASPRLELRAAADKDGLPLARQALRALGLSVGADYDALHDAELALTEACSNVIRHAYDDTDGTISVSLEARPDRINAVVRDHGRGIAVRDTGPREVGGLGLKVIEAVATDVEIRSEPGLGTEVEMALAVADGSPAAAGLYGESPLESVLRRLVATAAAQCDMAPGRISEALMAAEVAAREAPTRIVGGTVRLRIERDRHGVEIFLGPLVPGGAREIVRASGLPVVGSIVERLADAIWEVPPETGRPSDGEELALRFQA